MQFASIVYLAFLALSVAVYFALPGPRSRTVWLLAASFLFYYSLSAAWTLALLAVIAIAYGDGLLIDRLGDARVRKWALIAGIVAVVGILAAFKYARFAASLANGGLAFAGLQASVPLLRLALPVGVSFWTFQAIAYLVDVYRGDYPVERDPLRYALFASFFPVVTAGPITRARQLLPQLAEKHRFSYEGMRSGLLLMTWGFFKKLVVADSLGVIVEAAYRDPHKFTGTTSGFVLGVASLAFTIQLYCDFSGYTDIVRGSARLFGVELPKNFDMPYFARSIKEFWRRWHMSLMSWLRDYVYIPLGGSRVSKVRRYANLLAVFLISGLWHGAGLTFVFWGLLNGLFQIVGELTLPARTRLYGLLHVDRDAAPARVFQTLFTVGCVTVGWVFFRAQSFGDAFYILSRIAAPTPHVLTAAKALKVLGLGREQFVAALIGAVIVFGVEWLSTRVKLADLVIRQPLPVRWVVYMGAVMAVAVFGYYGPVYSAASFAYFKF